MASFFIYSKDGDSVFLGQRLLRDGHDVHMFVHNKESKNVGKGLIPHSTSPTPRKGDIVIFDMVGFGYYVEQLRKRGFKVLSGGRLADRLEFDRGFAIELMRSAGIAVPETREFKNMRDARAFLIARDPKDAFYIKPSGDEECGDTYGAKDIPDMLRWLAYLERAKKVPKAFLLQKKMDGSAELSLEGWFDGTKWVLPWNSTIEDKRFLAGDVGPNTGCMANVVWAYEDPMPLLAMRTLSRFTPMLANAGYVGPFDINVIFDGNGVPHGLEFTARFGYLALQSLMLLIGGDLGAQLWEFVNGTLDHFEVSTDKYSLAIGVSVPPYPTSSAAGEAAGLPLDPKLLLDPIRIMPTDVMVVQNAPYITGSDAGAAVFVDTGYDLHELRSTILERIKGYAIPKAQYRKDPVERAEREFEFLREHEYETPTIKPMEYKSPIPAPIAPERDHLFDISSKSGPNSPSMIPTTLTDLPAPTTDTPTFNE